MHIINTLPKLNRSKLPNFSFGNDLFFEKLNSDLLLHTDTIDEINIQNIKSQLHDILNAINTFYKDDILSSNSHYIDRAEGYSPGDLIYNRTTFGPRAWNFSMYQRFYKQVLYPALLRLDNYINDLNINIDFTYEINDILNINSFFDLADTSLSVTNNKKIMALISPVDRPHAYYSATNGLPQHQTLFVNSFINNFVDCYFNFTTFYDLKKEVSSKKVFSSLNPNFLKEFKLDQLPIIDCFNYTLGTDFSPNSFQLKHNRYTARHNEWLYFSQNDINPQINLSNTRLDVDRSLNGEVNAAGNPDKQYASCFNALHPSQIDKFIDENLNEFQIYHTPNWESKSNSAPTFKIVNRNFLNRRKGIFLPVLIKNKAYLNRFSTEEIYNLIIINFTTKEYNFKHNIAHYSLMSKAFLNFMNLYNFQDALYFKDKDEYYKAANSAFENNFLYASLKNKKLAFSDLKEHIDAYTKFSTNLNADEKKHFSFQPSTLLTEEYLSTISSTYEKNPLLERKKAKIKLKFQKLKQNIKNYKENRKVLEDYTTRNIEMLRQNYFRILHYNKLKQNSKIKLNNIDKYFKLTNLSKDLTNKIIEDQQLKVKNNQFVVDPFLLNLKQNHIHLLNVNYLSKEGKTVNFNSKSSLEKPISLYDVSEFSSVEFLIDKPVQIFVDGKQNPKAVKIGGPYVVKVTSSNLYIKLKDQNSFFGFFDRNPLFHPHVGTSGNENNSYQRACLGDAAPLLYNAFAQNNLKLIILSAMTWVCSANSTDVWGKRYRSFLDYDLFDADTLTPQENLTPVEKEKIIPALNDVILEQEFQEENLNETPTPQRLSEEEFTSTPETYVSYYTRNTH